MRSRQNRARFAALKGRGDRPSTIFFRLLRFPHRDWTRRLKSGILAPLCTLGSLGAGRMGGDGTQPRMTAQDRPASDRLDSWKEIAAYLNKEVRTVQRWEKNLGLPVRRIAQGKQGTVFAYKLDLDAWWQESQTKLEDEDDRSDVQTGAESDGPGVPGTGVESGISWSRVRPGVSGSNVVMLASAVDRIEKDRPDR